MTNYLVRPETALCIPLHDLIIYDARHRIHATHNKSLIELQLIIDRLKSVIMSELRLLGFAQAIGQLWK